jgi:hypothetical protein
MAFGKQQGNPLDRNPDFDANMTAAERAAAHAARAERIVAQSLGAPDKLATLASAHASLALYFQREAGA